MTATAVDKLRLEQCCALLSDLRALPRDRHTSLGKSNHPRTGLSWLHMLWWNWLVFNSCLETHCAGSGIGDCSRDEKRFNAKNFSFYLNLHGPLDAKSQVEKVWAVKLTPEAMWCAGHLPAAWKMGRGMLFTGHQNALEYRSNRS